MTYHSSLSPRADTRIGKRLVNTVLLIVAALAVTPQTMAQVDPGMLQSLHWRSIGPYRGGRTRAVAGVPSQPNVFYIAQVNGGVWKTTDYGRTWIPIFDDQPTGSVGSIAVAVSDPNIIYVGSGESTLRDSTGYGNGVYKSVDGARTWTHVGLDNTHHIGRVGHWAEQAIAANLASIHFTNVVSRAIVAPHGGRQSRFGTNPLTVGLPRRDAPPILLDFATSAVAVGKIRVAYNRKGPAPAGALIDHEGKPTTNPAVMYEEPMGALLTAAGHKGYALAMVCDLLGSALFGGATPQPSRLRIPGLYNNMLAIVFDPARFGAGEHYEKEASAFIEYVQSSKRTDPDAPIEVPGDAERRFRVQRAQSLPVDTGTLKTMDDAARAINTLRGAALPMASSMVVQ